VWYGRREIGGEDFIQGHEGEERITEKKRNELNQGAQKRQHGGWKRTIKMTD
jgi:hypothetical protein